jgi:AraC-like DNA-binding protein
MGRTTSVSAVAVLDLYDLLLELDVVTHAQLHAAGLSRAALIDHSNPALPLQEQRLDEAFLLALWQVASNNPQIPHIGLVIGQRFNPDNRGVLACWLFQCQQAGEALQVFQRHIALMNPSESWTVHEASEELTLEFSFAANKNYPLAAIERSMSALLRWSEEMTGVYVIPSRCEFSFPRPAHHERYTEIFGANLHFDSRINCLHLPRAFLHNPIRSANNYLKQVLEGRVLQAFQKLQNKGELLGKVRLLIQANLQLGVNIEQVCQSLHVSRPTLYRRLKQEDTSFTELLSSLRKERATQLIQQGLPAIAISDELGFKDVST